VRVVAGAIGGAALGGALGWFIPALFASQPHEFEALGLLALQALGGGFGAMVGFISGGALAAKYGPNRPPEADDQADPRTADSPDRGG
jgi:hypothetical protein